MKTFKKYSTARKYAEGEPIIQIGDGLFVVGIKSITEISIIDSDGHKPGFISAAKLSKLGNGNYAIPEKR